MFVEKEHFMNYNHFNLLRTVFKFILKKGCQPQWNFKEGKNCLIAKLISDSQESHNNFY